MSNDENKTVYRCDNCGAEHTEKTMIPLAEVRHLTQRVDEGGPMPSGECPECGAFCYPAPVLGDDMVQARIVIDVTYSGVDDDFKTSIRNDLDRNINSAVQVGLLGSDNEHSVDTWDVDVALTYRGDHVPRPKINTKKANEKLLFNIGKKLFDAGLNEGNADDLAKRIYRMVTRHTARQKTGVV